MCGWQCGDRRTETLNQLYSRLSTQQIKHYYSDQYASYRELLPYNQHTASKKYTYQLEQNNGRQRHGLRRFRRKSLIVTRSLEMLEYSLALFTPYRVNGSIGELISLVK